MNDDLPFLDLNEDRKLVFVSFGGENMHLPEGANLAAALLGTGVLTFRNSAISGAPRGPFCMMGACYDCRVKVAGETVQACMTIVRAGMVVEQADG
ncbi:MAG: (2Fe-2S)-binding protein [Rhodobacterales bacterium]|nr:(2Fe-2S)-binding protein [Pseudomonadota bacterium]NQW13844.1 (2Fe-2S)-binding protein [Rhodobacter sp.]